MKKFKIVMILLLIIVNFAACRPDNEENEKFDPDENLDINNVFFDDFTDGISRSNWEVCNEKWGVGNGGVIYQNVNYTSDGYVLLQANGDNYTGPLKGIGKDNGKRTGAALKSIDTFGPGRFEIKMKCMPRFGATTAFWTFFYKGTENAEIDIELNTQNDFRNATFTNWVSLEESNSTNVLTNVLNNDNEFHTYKFEWHTNPNRVDYYIDDVLYCTSESYVPQTAGKLWLGVWFPDAWAGTPDFETDYMIVDWVRVTPYLNNPYTETPSSSSSPVAYYPASPIEMPQTNWISNSEFNYDNDAWRTEIESNVKIENGYITIPENDITYQILSGIDETMDLVLKFKYKLDSQTSSGQILLEYRPLKTELLGKESYTLTNTTEWQEAEYHLSLPSGTKRIELSLIGINGSMMIDDVYLNLITRTK